MLSIATVLCIPTDNSSRHKFRICCHLRPVPRTCIFLLSLLKLIPHSSSFPISHTNFRLTNRNPPHLSNPLRVVLMVRHSCANLILHWNKGPHKSNIKCVHWNRTRHNEINGGGRPPLSCLTSQCYNKCTGLFISPSGISELDCATTKTDTAERSISIGRESLQDFFCTRGLGVLPGSTARG